MKAEEVGTVTIDKAELQRAEADAIGRSEPTRNQHVTPTTSVVICTRDRPDTIGRAVESVASQPVSEFEVLVLDQSQDSETRTIVERMMCRFPHVRYLHLDEVGLSRSRNAGFLHTQSELVAFTDDDCAVPDSWLPTIQRAFTQYPDIALLYGQVILPAELQDRTVDGVIPALAFSRLQRLSRQDGFRVFGMGANFAARRSTWHHIGGFDEALGSGGVLRAAEDFDFAYRVFRSGGTILLEPDVFVYHYGFRSYSQWAATLDAYGIGDGAFYMKHLRAGDLYAGFLLARRLIVYTAREVVHWFQRRGVKWNYVRGIVGGMRHSLRYKVDRRQRLYIISNGR